MTETISTPAGATPLEQMQAAASGDGLTLAQRRESIEFGLSRGFLTREQAAAELLAGGDTTSLAEPPPTPASHPAAERPTEVLYKPTDYTMPDFNSLETAVSGKEMTNTDLMRTQESVGGWLSAANVPPEIGTALTNHAVAHIQAFPKYDSMDEGARSAHRILQEGIIRRTWGDRTAENVALAQAMVRDLEAKRPGVTDFLERSGLGNSAQLILTLGNLARERASRK